MKRPDKSGWYWVQIPGCGREIVNVLTDGPTCWVADRMFEVGYYEIIETRGWRWLGRAIIEKGKRL